MTDIAKDLAEPFPKELLRQNKHKGNITYVAGSEVIARLNRVIGWDRWSYEVVRLWEAGEKQTDTGVYPMWCMAHIRLTVGDPDRTDSAARDGVGGQQVKFLNNGSGPNDLGDEYKGAVTDALKKAAQSLGVALDLARGEEAMRWEADQNDDMDCPFCGATVLGAKADREPMRAHLIEMHEYERLPDGSVKKPKIEGAEVSGSPGPQAGQDEAASKVAASPAPSPVDAARKALGAIKKAS